jgi:hypothetical protein
MLNVLRKKSGGMILGLLVGAGILGHTKNASACSIHINEVAMKNDLTARGLTELNITIGSVVSGNVTNYGVDITQTDPRTLCPRQIQFTGDLQVTYRKSALQTCTAQLHIVKTENWLEELTPGVDPESYVVTGIESVSCRPLLIRPRPIPRPF